MAKLDLGLPSYMGRGIISGLTVDGEPVDIYFVEGRSPPSRRRKLSPYAAEGRVHVDINSETTMEQMLASGGIPDLLLYDAIYVDKTGLIVVTNGFQTTRDARWKFMDKRDRESLVGACQGLGGVYGRIKTERYSIKTALAEALEQSGSEVDDLRTARIACARQTDLKPDVTSVGIVIRPRDTSGKGFLEEDIVRVDDGIKLGKGEFIMFTTYGVHSPPYHAALPPDVSHLGGYARLLHLDGTTAEQLMMEVWEALPKELLVGVAAAKRNTDQPSGFDIVVKNMQE
jgi:IMP cyclohydrolase